MINCLIVDDEPLAREGLSNYVHEIDFLHLVGMCENPIDASMVMGEQQVDLLFLDIQMPKINGIDFLKTLQNPPMVIITTAFPNYALESYQLDVLDYLLKPITFQRFFKAATKAKEYFSLLQKSQETSGALEDQPYFFIKCESKFEKIWIEKILYIEGLQNYVHIHTQEGSFMTLLTLKNVVANLEGKPFLQVHKSFIVAIDQVDGMEGNELLIGNARIPIGRSYKNSVLEQIINRNLWKR